MLAWAVFSPLLGFILTGLFGRMLGDRASQFITCSFMVISAVLSCEVAYQVIYNGQEVVVPLLTFLEIGDVQLTWTIKYDVLSSIMMIVVSSVSLCVHIYSVGYMHKDPSIPRFMAYLSLFTFMMMMLITAENLIQLFLGWEGVGLTSYLLIGFWYTKDSANAAAIKAFLMNRVGDLGLVVGLAVIYSVFNTFDIPVIIAMLPEVSSQTFSFMGIQFQVLEAVALLLFVGAMGKSAQLGLHTWLPDAMEGPTPVSALIHAATMVTAGVFLVVRMSPLYELAPFAREVVTFVGATTAFFAGTVALTQTDIKRVIAYSTCSQLGYMFFAAGVSAYSAAIFHLATHAFFKALLFLGSGSVIHAMSDEQDMRKMGGIWRLIPQTYILMWVGNLALAGIPFFAGYYSKELIISSTWLSNSWTGTYALYLGMASVFLTAFYSWRLLWMTFHGQAHADEKVMAHVHESPASMLLPLYVLGVGAVSSGYIAHHYGWFTEGAKAFWIGTVSTPLTTELYETVPHSLEYLATFLALAGILTAIAFYGRLSSLPARIAKTFKFLYVFFYNKWFFDELYNRYIIYPGMRLGKFFWERSDQRIIDGYGPDGIASWSNRMANRASQLQSGYLYNYLFAMVAGITMIATWFMWMRGE